MENQLQVIVKDSGLDETKARFILENFQNYFEIASEWTKKAQTIIVKSADQKADMAMARVGRLFLREKRIDIEKARKNLKEQALREGKAIDGIANVLKALIIPIEEYLDGQERFVEIMEAKEAEIKRIELETKIEADRIAKEKADKEELERLRIETEVKKRELEEKEKALQAEKDKAEAERKAHEEALAKEKRESEARAKAEKDKAEAERKAHEEALAKEKRESEARAKAEKDKAEAETKKQNEITRKKIEKEQHEKEELQRKLDGLIKCPKCGHEFKGASNAGH